MTVNLSEILQNTSEIIYTVIIQKYPRNIKQDDEHFLLYSLILLLLKSKMRKCKNNPQRRGGKHMKLSSTQEH